MWLQESVCWWGTGKSLSSLTTYAILWGPCPLLPSVHLFPVPSSYLQTPFSSLQLPGQPFSPSPFTCPLTISSFFSSLPLSQNFITFLSEGLPGLVWRAKDPATTLVKVAAMSHCERLEVLL